MANEIAIKDKERAIRIALELIEEAYCVMISKEEQLTIINYEWSPTANRNDMVFMPKDLFWDKYVELDNE